MCKRFDVAKIISNLASALIFDERLRKNARKYIYRILSEEHIAASNFEKFIANEMERKYISNINLDNYNQFYEVKQQKIVWQYLAQGYEYAPKIVQTCMNTVSYYFKRAGYRVINLNDENISDYLKINGKFLQMAKENKNGYSYAAYSDLLRCGLLYNFGGIWIDSTVLISDVPDILLNNDRVFFERSCEVKDRLRYRLYSDYFRWGTGVRVNWLSSIIKTPKGDILFGMLWDILNEYWSNESYYRHYFLCHIIFDQIKNRKNILHNYKYISISDTTPHDLQMILSKNANESEIENVLKYPIHKLTYKVDETVLSDGDNVFNYLINKYKNIII